MRYLGSIHTLAATRNDTDRDRGERRLRSSACAIEGTRRSGRDRETKAGQDGDHRGRGRDLWSAVRSPKSEVQCSRFNVRRLFSSGHGNLFSPPPDDASNLSGAKRNPIATGIPRQGLGFPDLGDTEIILHCSNKTGCLSVGLLCLLSGRGLEPPIVRRLAKFEALVEVLR